MIGVNHIWSLGSKKSVKQRGCCKAGIVEHSTHGTLVMTGVKRHTCHLHPIDGFPLYQPDLVAGIDFATRVVRKAGQDFHLEALPDQLTSKHQPLEGRFGIEPLCQQQNAGSHAI